MFDGGTTQVGREDLGAGFSAVGTGWREVHRKLQTIAKKRAALDAAEARLLVIAMEACVHLELGLGSFTEYLQRTLGYAPRTARERVRVAERLAQLPMTLAALERGETSFSAVRALTRDEVVDADNEAEWLEAIEGKTVREVEDLMVGRFPSSLPTDRQEPDLIPKRLMFELMPDVYADFLRAKQTLQEQTGEALDDSAVMAALCRSFEGVAPGKTQPQHLIAIHTCDQCERSTTDAAGQIIEIDQAAVAEARCDAAHVSRDGSITRDIPAGVRRLVELRDHNRCVVPGCRGAARVHMHHVEDRAEGGTHVPDNLCLLCDVHHGLLHRGKLRITGRAPDLKVTHEDGRPYGARAPQDALASAQATLRELGYTAAEAARAAAQVRATAPPEELRDLERTIRACLRACGSG